MTLKFEWNYFLLNIHYLVEYMFGMGVRLPHKYHWLPRKWDMDRLKRHKWILEGFGLYNAYDEFSLLYVPYDLRSFLDTKSINYGSSKLGFHQLWHLKKWIFY